MDIKVLHPSHPPLFGKSEAFSQRSINVVKWISEWYAEGYVAMKVVKLSSVCIFFEQLASALALAGAGAAGGGGRPAAHSGSGGREGEIRTPLVLGCQLTRMAFLSFFDTLNTMALSAYFYLY